MYQVLANEITPRNTALYGQRAEVVFEHRLLQLGLRLELNLHGLGLAVTVSGEPYYLRAFVTGSDVVFLISRDGCDGKSLRIVDAGLAHPIYYVVYGAVVAPVEKAHVKQVVPEVFLSGYFRYLEAAVLSDDQHFRYVGAVADVFALVLFFQCDAHETLLEVRVQLGIIVNYLVSCDGFEPGELRLAREVLTVGLLEVGEPVDGEIHDVVDFILDVPHFFLYGEQFLVEDLGVEFGKFPYRLVDQLVDVFHYDGAVQGLFPFLHLYEDGVFLSIPALEILL